MYHFEGHFIESTSGHVFVSQFGQQKSNTAILCLPSIFEELNLSRSIISNQAYIFSESNLCTYVLDYSGTGDSEGEIENVNAEMWRQDILATCHWLKEKGVTELILWGNRFGSLLAAAFEKDISGLMTIQGQLHWQPVNSGKTFMSQFIRIKSANEMMKGNEKTNWRQVILDGETTEIAGYKISSDLLSSLEKLKIADDFVPSGFYGWIEIASEKVTPKITKITQNWHQDLFTIECTGTTNFWQVPEVFEQTFLYPISQKVMQRILS